MCESSEVMVIKSNSANELLVNKTTTINNNNEMTLMPNESNRQIEIKTNPIELTKLKRTFTLPRNPFVNNNHSNNNTIRMSKRSKVRNQTTTTKDLITQQQQEQNEMELKSISITNSNCEIVTNENNEKNHNNNNNRKLFRRPSIRRFINKIAQHISGVPVMVQTTNQQNNERIPTIIELNKWKPNDIPGVTGLKNHGNTCFINAVIQCISNTNVLAEYFVLDKYKIDLTKRNKLNSKKYGTKGELTEQLALLLKSLWACQYNLEFSQNFKLIVERHGIQYKGNQQHDALEFLQWLLDKVHEDLNTASKRKYKSIKTSGRPDEVIAAETLENYKRCNNSFIQGIFQAQYRSSLSCSRCRTQSNTFDPFQCISVPLPQFNKHSIFVNVLYTSQQPRQVKIGLSLSTEATISELRDILESDTSIKRTNMLLTEINNKTFLHNFNDQQSITLIKELDEIYCIEIPQLKDVIDDENCTSPYILLCWINVVINNENSERFGSPYIMQVSRDTSYDDLQKLLLKEMSTILHDDILTTSQPRGIFKIRICENNINNVINDYDDDDDNDIKYYLEPDLEHPLFMEIIDQSLELSSIDGGQAHVKLILEFNYKIKSLIIFDDFDLIEEHSSVKLLKKQVLNGGIPLTLEECLKDYTEAEILTDAWRCPFCQQYQPVIKTLDVWSLPDILIVHFKRFRQQSLRGCNSTKLTTMVEFPVENLDMSPHLAKVKNSINRNFHHHHHHHNSSTVINDETSNNWSPWKRHNTTNTITTTSTNNHNNNNNNNKQITNDNIYDLYAICYHHGSDLETGHYTAACKNSYNNQWYLYDDAKVTNLNEQINDDINQLLVNNSAYILFYQKRLKTINNLYTNNNINNYLLASTSNSCINDHWINKMPKFQPPKIINNNSNSNNNDNNNKKDGVVINNSTKNELEEQEIVVEKLENIDTKYSDNINNIDDKINESDDNKLILSKNNTTNLPIYTTSIYINSNGNAEIKSITNCTTTTTAELKKPSTTQHDNYLINNKISNDNVDDDVDEIKSKAISVENDDKIYTTIASVHRCSDNKTNKTHLNWLSPQPVTKLSQSPESV